MAIEFDISAGTGGTPDSFDRQWTLVYASLDGTALADISQAVQRSFSFRLNKPNTCIIELNLLHNGVDDIVGDPYGLILSYKRRELIEVYEVQSIQAAGEGSNRSIKLIGQNASYARLMKRYIGQSLDGVTYTDKPRGSIAAQIIATENVRQDMGIRIGNVAPTERATAGPWYVKQALEAIDDLATPLNGFDYWFEPHDPQTTPTSVVGHFQASPVRGSFRENSTFEYGQGRGNLRQYDWLQENNHRINRAISLPVSWPDNYSVPLITQYSPSIAALIGLREDIIENELADAALRQALVDEHIQVRKYPRSIYTFHPHFDDFTGRVPTFPWDYNLGDIVRGIVNDSGVLLLDGWVRVYGIDITLDTQGAETVTLTTVDEV